MKIFWGLISGGGLLVRRGAGHKLIFGVDFLNQIYEELSTERSSFLEFLLFKANLSSDLLKKGAT
jgi:hypothetical protein